MENAIWGERLLTATDIAKDYQVEKEVRKASGRKELRCPDPECQHPIIRYCHGEIKEAIQRINRPLSDIEIFHTDCSSEFKNKEIDEIISAFGITRSLSHKGCPYDNAVAEVTYNIIKTEFVFGEKFNILIMLTGISQTVMLGLKLTNMLLY